VGIRWDYPSGAYSWTQISVVYSVAVTKWRSSHDEVTVHPNWSSVTPLFISSSLRLTWWGRDGSFGSMTHATRTRASPSHIKRPDDSNAPRSTQRIYWARWRGRARLCPVKGQAAKLCLLSIQVSSISSGNGTQVPVRSPSLPTKPIFKIIMANSGFPPFLA
jgi:hypothetical protein